MFVVLYRWRVKPYLERQFVAAWSEITSYYREHCGSLGSRLHRGSDGIFYSYAQWKCATDRDVAFANKTNSDGGERMREAIEESFPEIVLETVADYVNSPEKK